MTGWPRWDRRDVAGLARFVLPAEAGPLGPFPGKGDPVPRRRLRAIYDALAAIGIAYEHEPVGGDEDDETVRQVIRSPHEVLADRRPAGTCLDVCLTGAGLALRAGLHPFVVILGDHALLAVWVGDADDPAGTDWDGGPGPGYPLDGPAEPDDLERLGVCRDIGSAGSVIAIDLTLVTAGYATDVVERTFEDAVAQGGRAWSGDVERAQVCDVGREWRAEDQLDPAVGWDVSTPLFDTPFFVRPDATMVRSPTQLTRAQFRVVDYQESDLHTVMVSRCEVATADHPHVWVVSGAGGSGKTRLASEVAVEMEAAGWTVGLVNRAADLDLDRLRATRGPLLVAVDYADAVEVGDLESLVRAVAGPRRGPVVVMLLARTAGAWWTLLDDALVVSRVAVHADVLDPVAPPARRHQHDMWRAACRGFAAHLDPGRDVDALPVPPGDRWTSLDLVLLAWLRVNPEVAAVPETRHDLYDEVLRHEDRYWEQRVAGGSGAWRRWAARLSVAAPEDAVTAGALLADAETTVVAAFELAWGGGRVDDGLALRPDAVGDHLVRQYFATRPDELATLVDLLADRDRGHDGPGLVDRALANLARAETDHAEALAVVEALFASLLDGRPTLWPAFLVRALYGSEAAAAVLARALDGADTGTPAGRALVEGLIRRLPLGHAGLRALALRAAERWHEADTDESDAARANRLDTLATRLSGVGRRAEALGLAEEAVAIRRQLVEVDEGAFLPSLAVGLNNLGIYLAEVGRRAEALVPVEEAVAIRRRLVAVDEGAFLPGLASSLTNLGVRLAEVGRRAEALVPVEEAVAIRRRLVAVDEGAFLPDLASSLTNLGVRLSKLGRRAEALVPAEEAVAIYRRLVGVDVAAFLPDLAMSLTNLGVRLAEVGRRAEALGATEEAVAIRRQLVGVDEGAFLPELASGLNNLGVRLSEVGRRAEALAPTEEAVAIYRRLVAVDEGAFLPELAMSLNNLGVRLSEMGRRAEALAPTEEAVAIRRRLVAVDEGAFLPDLASSLTNLGVRMSRLGRRAEALGPAEEAVAIYRRLVAVDEGAFLPDLALNSSNLGVYLAEVGRRAEALGATEEAVAIYRRLVEVDEGAFLPDLASGLTNLGVRLAGVGRRAEALVPAEEAVAIYRRLVGVDVAAFLPDLAMSLNNLGVYLSEAGRRAEALVPAEEAVAIRRRLVAVDERAFLPDLAVSLSNLGVYLAEVGRRAEGLGPTEEAVAIRRRLVGVDEGAFLPDLASGLTNLGVYLAEVGRRAEALGPTEEAVAIYRRLVAVDEGAFLPDLASGLTNLGARLSEVERRAEALGPTEEAVAIYRRLVAVDERAFLPNLATALNNLGIDLAEVGRRAEALVLAEEAVAIRRRLVAVDEGAFLPDLAVSVANLSFGLSALGRRAEALGPAEEVVAIRRRLVAVDEGAFLPDLAAGLNALDRVGEGAWWAAGPRSPVLEDLSGDDARAWLLALGAGAIGDESARRTLLAEVVRLADTASGPLVGRARRAVRPLVTDLDDPTLPLWARGPLDDATVDRLNAWLAASSWAERREWLAGAIGDEVLSTAVLVVHGLYPETKGLDPLVSIVRSADPVEAAAAFLAQGEEDQVLGDIVSHWLATESWPDSRRHFTEHADALGTDRARGVLRALAGRGGRAARLAAQHLAILDLVGGRGLDPVDVFLWAESGPTALRRGLRAIDDGDIELLVRVVHVAPAVLSDPPHGTLLGAIVAVANGEAPDTVEDAVAQAYAAAPETVAESGRAHLGRLLRHPHLARPVRALAEGLVARL